MNKIFKRFLPIILIFTLLSCAYEPMFSEKSYNFKMGEIKFEGNKDINRIIKSKFNLIKDDVSKDKDVYDLIIKSEKDKIIVAKDTKGDPSKFELIIKTDYKIKRNQKLLLKNKIIKNNIYNNVSDKFKLEQNERIIIDNLSEKISDEIITSIMNLDDN